MRALTMIKPKLTMIRAIMGRKLIVIRRRVKKKTTMIKETRRQPGQG
jgi:hypothetical protein